MTYYEVLEIDNRASTAEIERAFRRMARKVHPDLNAGDRAKAEARMKLLNEIRDTLTDPLLRAGYDERLRLEAFRREAAVPPRTATPRPVTTPPAPSDAVPAGEEAAPIEYAPAPPTERPRSTSLWVGLFLAVMGGGVLVVAMLSGPKPGADSSDGVARAGLGGDAGTRAAFAFDAAPLLTAPVAPRAAADEPSEPATAPRRARGRGVVIHVGSTADDVLRVLGSPDRYEPGRRPGDAVLHYGALRLEMKNGRVVGGDAAAR
jgi:hypothetical protein